MNMKGTLPLLILQTLARESLHGYGIARHIKDQSEGLLDFAEGTLYPTLHSLEKDGLIAVAEEEVNGRSRKVYRLTDAGKKSLMTERAEWQHYSRVISVILGDA